MLVDIPAQHLIKSENIYIAQPYPSMVNIQLIDKRTLISFLLIYLIYSPPPVQPHITPFTFDEEPSMGESVQVSCYVNKGDMPMDFSWMLNGEPISTAMSVNVTPFGKKTSVLSIEYVDQSHIGNYTCVASNRAGIATYTAELFVKGRDRIALQPIKSFCNPSQFPTLCCFSFHLYSCRNRFNLR